MTVSIRKIERYKTACSTCSKTEEFVSEDTAEVAADNHTREHERFQAVGQTLAGRVCNSRAPGLRMFGIVNAFEDYAKEQGYSFMEWNGSVYTVGAVDFRNPLCRASDVPGLTR